MTKATVCIWMPSGPLTVLGVGHAGLKVTTAEAKKYYITWMAHGSPFKALLPIQQKQPYKYIDSFTYQDDKQNMVGFFGQENPHHKVHLPTLSLPPATDEFRYGVDVGRIERFWLRRLNLPVKNRERHYAFLSTKQNCTGCVVEALRAGGLDLYIDKPNNWFVQDARTLLTWVQQADDKIRQLNDLQTKINDKMQELTRQHGALPRQDRVIPSFAEWKKDSDANVSFRAFAERKDQIAALDELIKDYPNARDNLPRFVMLIKMQSEVYSHVTSKPKSDRTAAVRKLGVRVTAVLNDLLDDDLGFDQVSDQIYSWVIRTLAWRT